MTGSKETCDLLYQLGISAEDRIAMRRSAGNFEPPSAIALSEWQKEIVLFEGEYRLA